MDAIYGGNLWNSIPSTWSLSPFDNDWPSSIFMSMDPVAIDSVAFDFLSQQWPDKVLECEGVQDYLHEAALAGDPASGTCYDPEDDGTCMSSLGVHEHWNNEVDKQYSRNMGIGDGIELSYIASDPNLDTFELFIPAIYCLLVNLSLSFRLDKIKGASQGCKMLTGYTKV